MRILPTLSGLRGYLQLGLEKLVRPHLGGGTDHTDPGQREAAARALARLHPRRMALEVTEVIRETADTRTLRMARTDGPIPPFRAGQYVNLYLEVDGVRTSRPYSISSPPGAEHLDLTVRNNPGGFVAPHLFRHTRVGDRFVSSGPTGTFVYEPLTDGDDLVFLAGGSGITPFMSMLRDQAARGWPQRIQLLYGSRLVNGVVFGRELKALAADSERFEVALVVSEPPRRYKGLSGFLDADLIRDRVGELAGKRFYVCGPPAMYDLVERALAELGIEPHRVRRELYGPPADPTREPGWPEGLAPSTRVSVAIEGGPTLSARAGEPLLNTLERHGLVVPAACRSGECSLCRLKVLSGRVLLPAHHGVRESDRWHGYVHACVAYPLEDLRVRVWQERQDPAS